MKLESEPMQEKYDSVHHRAFEIAGGGNYEEIANTLTKENLLSDEIERVRERYGKALESAKWMTAKDWEMLAIMDCYDERTADHCVETFRIAEDRIDRFKAGDRKFSKLIENENVPLAEFFRACLFHDIGKCCIPRSILNNHLSDDDFGNQLCHDILRGGKAEILADIENVTGQKFIRMSENDAPLREYLLENHIHTMRYVPAVEMLDKNDINIARERFPSIDISKATLADLLEPHEEASEKILIAEGFEIAGHIAGRHHNYRKLDMRFPVSTEVLGVTIALEELLALSDIKQALSSKRSYKNALSTPLILRNLIVEAERHEISFIITSLWVEQELALISREESLSFDATSLLAMDECRNFIKKHSSSVSDFVAPLRERLAA
ncbi:MAG: hypothetical protein AAB628_01450 [Patescibacteria group bacterium]